MLSQVSILADVESFFGVDRLSRKLAGVHDKLERICRVTGNLDKLKKIHTSATVDDINKIRFVRTFNLSSLLFSLLIRILLQKGLTPLHLCCLHGQVQCVQYLLDVAGADHRARSDDDGATPIHFACWGGSRLIVIMLMERGNSLHESSKVNS